MFDKMLPFKSSAADEYGRGSMPYNQNILKIEFNDDYDHPVSGIEYVLENVLYEFPKIRPSSNMIELRENFNSVLLNNCRCMNNSQCDDCPHGGNYSVKVKADGNKELVLKKPLLRGGLVYECFDTCSCSSMCLNRLLQYGPRKNLEIIKTKYLNDQYGVITTKFIPEGGFICEYAGEILTKEEAKRRQLANEELNYILCMNEVSVTDDCSLQIFIDPTRKGNIGRYINHSCEPNCETMSVRVDGVLPRVGIYANRDIERNEELTFDYGGGVSMKCSSNSFASNGKPCLCKSLNCKGYLPSRSYELDE